MVSVKQISISFMSFANRELNLILTMAIEFECFLWLFLWKHCKTCMAVMISWSRESCHCKNKEHNSSKIICLGRSGFVRKWHLTDETNDKPHKLCSKWGHRSNFIPQLLCTSIAPTILSAIFIWKKLYIFCSKRITHKKPNLLAFVDIIANNLNFFFINAFFVSLSTHMRIA